MTTDEQLDACLAIEAIWKQGDPRLADLGIDPITPAPSVVPPSTTEGAPSAIQRWFDRMGDCWMAG